MAEEKRMYDKQIDHSNDMTYENEGLRDMSPMVQISIKEYDKLKERGKYITHSQNRIRLGSQPPNKYLNGEIKHAIFFYWVHQR